MLLKYKVKRTFVNLIFINFLQISKHTRNVKDTFLQVSVASKIQGDLKFVFDEMS